MANISARDYIQATVEHLEKHGETGEDFFNALDDDLCSPMIYDAVHSMIKDAHRYTFILTGQFGRGFLEYMLEASMPHGGYILFPGGLRKGQVKRHVHHYLPVDQWTGKACFVDDSIYSGTTRETAIQQLYVPEDIPTYVAYDGMLEVQPWVMSLYRYHVNNC